MLMNTSIPRKGGVFIRVDVGGAGCRFAIDGQRSDFALSAVEAEDSQILAMRIYGQLCLARQAAP